MAIIATSLICCHTASNSKADGERKAESLTLKELRIQDSKGDVRAKLFLNGEDERPFLVFYKADGGIGAVFGIDSRGGMVNLCGAGASSRQVQIAAGVDDAHILILDQKRELVQIATTKGSNHVTLYDDSNKPRVKLAVIDEAGNIEIRDKNGLVFRQPEPVPDIKIPPLNK